MGMAGEIVYKRTTTGAVQVWQQELSATGDAYRTVSGQLDGKRVTSEWTVCAGKNLGRANATSPTEQALKEVEANYRKQLAQGGYWKSVEDIDQERFFEPMLAKDFADYPPTDEQYARGRIYSQPKLDGMRCIARASGLWSRNGKPILSCPHVVEALRPLFRTDPNLILDGELYNHKLRDDFDKIMSLARQSKPTNDDLAESAKLIQYHVYDYPSFDGPFADRMCSLVDVMADMLSHPIVYLVPTFMVSNLEHLDQLYESYLDTSSDEGGYEGQIVRIDGTPYENKRTKQLLKRKVFKDAEFEIDEIVEGVGNRAGMVGFVRFRLPDGRTFKADPMGDRAYKRDVFARRECLIGKQATVKFFDYTPAGIPRFGKVKVIHETPRD